MKKNRSLAVGVALAALSLSAVADQEIVVGRGESKSVTESLTFSKMTLHGDLTAQGVTVGGKAGTVLTAASGAVIELAPDAGDVATLTMRDAATFDKSRESGALLKTGAGTGKIRSDVWWNATGRWPAVEVSSQTPADADGVVRLLELAQGPFWHAFVTNKNEHPVEFRFAGGTLAVSLYGVRSLVATEQSPIILRGDEAHDIQIGPGWYPWYMGGVADRSVVTTGACDVVVSASDRGPNDWGRLYLKEAVAWGHTGDLVADGVEIQPSASNVLPHGAGTGGVVLRSSDWQVANGYPLTAILDLNGTTQTVNSLDVSQNSCATNRRILASALVFGADGVDGTLKGLVAANVKVRKLGAGTLTLDGATITAPDVVDGGLSVTGVTTVAGLGDLSALTPVLAEKGLTGMDENYGMRNGGSPQKVMTTSGLFAATPRPIAVQPGGTLVFTNAADAALERLVSIDAKGAFVKAGAGALSVRGSAACPQRFAGLVRAAAGRLSFSGMGVTNAFWRVTVTKLAKSPTLNALSIGEFGLFDATGVRVNQKTGGYKYRADATAATDLKAGEVLATPGLVYATDENGDKTPNCMFKGEWYNWMNVTGTTTGEALTEVAFTFRLHDDTAAPAQSYAFSSAGAIPSTWTVETSPDGVNWTLADARTEFYESLPNAADYGWYYWHLDGRWGGISGLPLTFAYANERTTDVDLTGATLRADAGATLDVSCAAGQPVGIQVDATAPGGTIVGMPSVRDGTLEIVNLPDGTPRSSLTSVASLVTCAGGALTSDDLATWRVTVNGARTRLRVTKDADGHIGVVAPGLAILIR